MIDLSFFKGKKVFLTGHTGFKGSWLSRILITAGAELTGYALAPEGEENLFSMLDLEAHMHSIEGDIRDREKLVNAVKEARPEIVLHLAAQPIVRTSYKEPAYTYETNVMGTVNILEAVRATDSVKSFLNVTTDKVYKNREWAWGYRENEELDGYDPYSNSKSCSELVTHSYRDSFLTEAGVAVSTARAGNVIGGGDFAVDRIVPDCVRAMVAGNKIQVRNPFSTRPYQHVLEPLAAYLQIAKAQYEDPKFADAYNVGPDDVDCIQTGELTTLFCKYWGEGATWENCYAGGPHEANFLKLDSSKIKTTLGWKPVYGVEDAIRTTVEWYKAYVRKEDMVATTDAQIKAFFIS